MPQSNEYLILNMVDPPDTIREKNMFVFRYSDLTEEAQKKFARLIKWDSSIWTVRALSKEGDIRNILSVLNPILMRGGWKGGFSSSTLYRWYENKISRLIFHSRFRLAPTLSSYDVESVISTPGIREINSND